MKFAEVAENVKQLVEHPPAQDDFIYALLLTYGTPKATIDRLKKGPQNLAKEPGEVLLKKKVWFRPVAGDLFAAIEELKKAKAAKTNDPRFLIVTDFKQLLAVDRKTGDTLDIKIPELETHFAFFLPWAGMEKTKLSNENPADVKAAEKMAKLFDAIKQDNPDYMRHDAHAMNVFLARLLFCLFAEDTGIFPENAGSNAIASHTAEDGSDLDAFFKQLFDLLDTPDKKRGNLPDYLKRFPYVNGGLFRDHYDIPAFSAKSRRMLIEAGTLTWAEINPDIFGSMFQAVIDPEERHNLGQHYTSVTNIMKVIEPLFRNDFKEELDRARNLIQKNVRTKALNELHDRLAKVKIFDPACGSGNFLIIAYKELRKLEMELFEAMNAFPVSRITVDQFYGIEIADFACETATLSLWLAEHQMNLEYQKRFKQSLTSLPLKDGAHIVCGNACRIDWETVCPKNEGDEIYILGNPPYLGARVQSGEQKGDTVHVLGHLNGHKNLDYISSWFYKAALFIRDTQCRSAFVSTNSIAQGEQAELLWPHIFQMGLEISFAHQPFKWSNMASGKAGVTCVIIGLRADSNDRKIIYNDGVLRTVSNINAYLVDAGNTIVSKRRTPLSSVVPATFGSMPNDGGFLIFSGDEKNAVVAAHPTAERFFRKLIGTHEFINGEVRWCLWLSAQNSKAAQQIPEIKKRIDEVIKLRGESSRGSTTELAKIPYAFGEIRHQEGDAILIPCHSSERREYIPLGYLTAGDIIHNSALAVYKPSPTLFGILLSKVHMAWARAVGGGLETRIRYSASICYNTFPIPDLTEEQKQTITMHVGNVLEEREKHPEKTMAQLYDPDKMPAGLREAHHQLDLAVDRIYRSKPFASDEERLEHLFKLYEEMTAREKLI